MLYIETAKMLVEVRVNPDGTLFLTSDGVNSIPNAGALICNYGGIDKTLQRAIETELSLDQLREQRALRKQHSADLRRLNEQKKISKIKEEYEQLIAAYPDGIETTVDNIRIVAAYLTTVNWGSWHLPTMSIAYTANQYDCDGRTAVTITLDTPIYYRGEKQHKFVFNAPRAHLMKYAHLGLL